MMRYSCTLTIEFAMFIVLQLVLYPFTNEAINEIDVCGVIIFYFLNLFVCSSVI